MELKQHVSRFSAYSAIYKLEFQTEFLCGIIILFLYVCNQSKYFIVDTIFNLEFLIDLNFLETKLIDCTKMGIALNDSNELQEVGAAISN